MLIEDFCAVEFFFFLLLSFNNNVQIPDICQILILTILQRDNLCQQCFHTKSFSFFYLNELSVFTMPNFIGKTDK